MMRRSVTSLSLLVLVAAPLSAQMKEKDPTTKVAGGALPAGWSGRTDKASDKLADAKFVTMGSGYHVTSGPAAIYWNDKSMTKGPYTATATFRQTKKPQHPEAYGMIFGGNKLDTPDQTYFYVLVRGDGKVLINHRAGAEVHKLMDWTEVAAAKKEDANGSATNTISIDASKPDSIRLSLNGARVGAVPGASDGTVGLRVNHNLDVHVSDFKITPKK
ncbi:MAG: hypothetical protein JWL61_663 [Gemmatimonadetes bacterium]|jgi:hypothetical protein|nr:hypothetical protein [Gemmatimonadota bacterium]